MVDPVMATFYLITAAGFGCGAHWLSTSTGPRRRLPASVAGALTVITLSVLVGLLGGRAVLLVWATVVGCVVTT